jgi:threonine-phosphate decarboxylase
VAGSRHTKQLFGHGGTVYSAARYLGVAPEEILDFSASINPLGPPPGVRASVMAAFDRVVHYPDPDATELRDALARRHGVRPFEVCPVNGSTELIHLLPRLIPGSRALIVAPPFSEYASALEKGGWEVHYFILEPGNDFSLSLPKLAERLEDGFDLLILANPGNPTGALVPLPDVIELLELCRISGTVPVIDEAFMDFREEESAISAVVSDGHGVVSRSVTKFYALPGLRLGYAVAAAGVIEQVSRLVPPWSVGTLAQAAGVAALADDAYRERTLRLIARERKFLAAGLAALPGLRPFPSAANYLLVELASALSATILRDRLLPHRILIRDCANFPGLSNRFFRVAVRGHEDNRQLLFSLAEILGA